MRLATYERRMAAGLLLRFFHASLRLGRMPSLLGREIFRSRESGRSPTAFEDTVIFLCDVEKCLASLAHSDQRLIALCVFEDRSEWEAARVFGQTQTEISRRLGRTLDLLYETFCRGGMLKRLDEYFKEEEERRSA
jgi:DNA-directed RNA polymerase specialized sigma24 family protein